MALLTRDVTVWCPQKKKKLGLAAGPVIQVGWVITEKEICSFVVSPDSRPGDPGQNHRVSREHENTTPLLQLRKVENE
jgi:hypothetical protein